MMSQRKNDDLRVNDFNKMHYMERVLKECLRIYPPVAYIARHVTEDFIHGTYQFLINQIIIKK